MTCPEIINTHHRHNPVDLNRYKYLHPEGKHLIYSWFQRSWQERNCPKEQAFEPFVFAWFAFNGWAACVTNLDRDREIIDSLSVDSQINNDFKKVYRENPEVMTALSDFFELLPIFDAKLLQRNNLLVNRIGNRRERVNYYLLHGMNAFEPRCWQRHNLAGEATPVDWGHFINSVYKVRCNLFHGLKAAHSEMDQTIVHSSYLALVKFLNEVGYLKM